MKKQISNTRSVLRKGMISLGFFGFALFGFTTAFANSTTEKPPVVSYAGSVNGQPLFQVNIDNKNGDVYLLSITDDEGNLLYSEKIKDQKVSRTFQYNQPDREDAKLTFVLAGEKEKQTQVFKINTNTQVVQDVVVTRL